MKKNRMLSMMLLSIFTLSALTIPARARASVTAYSVVKAGLIVVGVFAGLKLLQNIFFSGSEDEGEAGGVKIKIVTGDITKQNDVDAIVNAANEKLKMGGGVCGAIFSKAGSKCLEEKCEKALKKHGGKIPVGKSVITDGCNLNQKIIHTVPPNFNPGNKTQSSIEFDERGKNKLKKAYTSALDLAEQKGIKKIAFPVALSMGHFAPPGVDKQELVDIALTSVAGFCRFEKRKFEEIRFVAPSKEYLHSSKRIFDNRFKRAKRTVFSK